MVNWRKWTLVLAAFLMLSACGGNNANDPVNNVNDLNEPEDVQEDNDDSSAPNDDNETDQQNQEDVDQETNEDIVDEPEVDEEITIDYYMNGIYDIVPIDAETTNRNIVLLTFDDGPKDEQMVNDMLDILDQHQAKAIFFVNGFRVEQNPELLKLIHDRGHPIGNHAWDHVNLRNLSKEEQKQQVADVQDIVEELTGERPLFFRPPHGAGNDTLREVVAAEGMLYMTWSNGSEDWVYKEPETVIERVMEQLRPGSNILMHELEWTIEALDTLLAKLDEEGYDFVHPLSIQISE